MGSMSIARETSNHVKIHDNSKVEQLVKEATSTANANAPTMSKANASVRRARLKRPQSTPNSVRRSSQGQDNSRIPTEWLSNKTVGTIQEKTDMEAKKTKKMYDSVLETEDTFVKDMNDLVQHKSMLDLRKREILYKKWSDKVYEPLHRQISTQINGPGYPELQWRKRQLHKDYLEHVNRKGHVFLDTIAPDEYFAMALHPTRPGMLVASTEPLKDPLLLQDRSRNEEDRTILRCALGTTFPDQALMEFRLPPLPLVPLGRHGTECSTWTAMPMGEIESPVRLASRRRMLPHVNESHFTLERWGETCPQTLVNEEMRIQRKRPNYPKNPVTIPLQPTVQNVGIQCEM